MTGAPVEPGRGECPPSAAGGQRGPSAASGQRGPSAAGGQRPPIRPGDELELRVTPDRYLTIRYAGASGDFNPIHIDDELARRVGLPGRILHGLWTMSQVARAHTERFGGPGRLKRLHVQFRGMGVMEREVLVTGRVREVREDGSAIVDCEARQDSRRLVRNGVAEIRP